MFLHNGEEFERHTAGAFGPRLPFFHRAFTGIKIAGKNELANVIGFAKFFAQV